MKNEALPQPYERTELKIDDIEVAKRVIKGIKKFSRSVAREVMEERVLPAASFAMPSFAIPSHGSGAERQAALMRNKRLYTEVIDGIKPFFKKKRGFVGHIAETEKEINGQKIIKTYTQIGNNTGVLIEETVLDQIDGMPVDYSATLRSPVEVVEQELQEDRLQESWNYPVQ